MVNTRAKGSRIRLKCIKELEANGYLVGIVERTGKFIKIKDLFGLFDLCAIGYGQVRFIQVTCNKPHPHKPYTDFSDKYVASNPSIVVEQHVWYDKGKEKGWKKWLY